MRKSLLSLLTVVLLAGTAVAQQGSGLSMNRGGTVYIDLERVFNEFYKTQLAKSRFQVQQKDLEAEKQVLVDEMTAINEEVDVLKKEARDITLDEEIRSSKRILFEERLLDLRGKQKEIDEFVARRQEQHQQQVARMSKKIMDEIRESVVDYAKTEGMMAVIDSSTRRAAVGVFIYTHPEVQITDDILSLLNSKQPDNLDTSDLFSDVKGAEIEKQ